MELWDIYNSQGEKTGRQMQRGKPQPGEYMLAVHIYIQDKQGRWLLQKRSATKESMPGIWEVTGGAVLFGESSLNAAIRETKEEVGVSLKKEELSFAARLRRSSSFVDIWFAQADFSLANCVLQKEEVEAVRLLTTEQLLHWVDSCTHREKIYRSLVTSFISQL